jgi:hypothetical protein
MPEYEIEVSIEYRVIIHVEADDEGNAKKEAEEIIGAGDYTAEIYGSDIIRISERHYEEI